MEALKAIKIIGNQNDGRTVFLFGREKNLAEKLSFVSFLLHLQHFVGF